MSLLDFLDSPDAKLGMALLSAGGPSATPMNLGQRLAGGVQSFQQQQQSDAQAKMKSLYLQSQIDENTSQNAQRAAALAAAQRQQAALRGAFQPGAPGGLNVQAMVAAGIDPKKIAEYASLQDIGRPEVARTVEGLDEQGRPATFQVDKFGQRVGAGLPQWKAPVALDVGGQTGFVDPVTLQPRLMANKSQTPDSLAGNAVTLRGQDLSSDTTRRGQDLSSETARRGQDFTNQRALDAQGGAAKLTEDQGKATGWLVQAENAFKNMNAAVAADPSVAKPGLGDGLGALPLMGGLGNLARPAQRQNFLQGASSLSEALLRAATGAGVQKAEAEQKIKELTPQFGDSDATIKQKMASIPLYIESLKVRAGPGAAKAAEVMGGARSAMPPSPPAAPMQSRFVEIDGRQVAARRAADGNYYVQRPGGKWARVVD